MSRKKHKTRTRQRVRERIRIVETPDNSGITPLLSPEATAKAIGLTTQTLAAWRVEKKYLPFVKIGWYVMYRAEDVEQFIQSRIVGTQPPTVSDAA